MTVKQTIVNSDAIFGGRITNCRCPNPVAYEGFVTTLAGHGRDGDKVRVDGNHVTFQFKCLGCQRKTTYYTNHIEKRQYEPDEVPPKEGTH